MERLMLTVPEVAQALNIKRTTVYELMRRGDIPSVKIGKSRRIHRQQFDAYVEQLVAPRAG